jgi:hypothetical protein
MYNENIAITFCLRVTLKHLLKNIEQSQVQYTK